MLILKTTTEILSWRKQTAKLKNNNNNVLTIGFVPTMGALHSGHAELLKKARDENDLVVLSIFVNPTQFNDANDFVNYPKTYDQDLKIAQESQVDVLFFPQTDDIYSEENYFVQERSFSKILCGASRAGHFDGVLTVVLKLFNLVGPHRAYFGEKDFQQLSLIQGMVRAFYLPIDVIPVPTMRESSGLAMSSRNQRLSPEAKEKASDLYSALKNSASADEARKRLSDNGFKIDYIEDHTINGRQHRFGAVFLEGVRLIDNIQL